MADLQTLFEGGSDEFARVVGAVPDDSWSTPTPCDIAVRELVEHVLAGNEFAVRLLAGASAADAVAGIDEIRLGPDPVQQVVTSCAKQSDAFGTATADRLLHHPSGDIDLDTFVRFRLAELVIHGWDIATAIGLDRPMDADLADELWRRVEPHLDQMRSMEGAYGDGASGELAPDAALEVRLLDAFGRRSR